MTGVLESGLVQYGVLGLWTLSLLFEKVNFHKKQNKLIENNTKALVEFKMVSENCRLK